MDEIDYKLRSQNPTLISHVSMASKINFLSASDAVFDFFSAGNIQVDWGDQEEIGNGREKYFKSK